MMNNVALAGRSLILSSLARKLDPNCFTAMSGKMAAITGFIIGARFTKPEIVEMVVTSDGFVLARDADEIGLNAFIGTLADLRRNWNRLLDVADLTSTERKVADSLFRLSVRA